MLKSNFVSDEVIQMTFELIQKIVIRQDFIPDEKYIKKFCDLIKNDKIKNNDILFTQCVQIIRSMNTRKKDIEKGKSVELSSEEE